MPAIPKCYRRLIKYDYPNIVNVDQGSQFVAEAFVGRVYQEGVKSIAGGKVSLRDNVFV